MPIELFLRIHAVDISWRLRRNSSSIFFSTDIDISLRLLLIEPWIAEELVVHLSLSIFHHLGAFDLNEISAWAICGIALAFSILVIVRDCAIFIIGKGRRTSNALWLLVLGLANVIWVGRLVVYRVEICELCLVLILVSHINRRPSSSHWTYLIDVLSVNIEVL